MKVTGGCHCGAVRYAAEVPREVELLDCNCSICRKSGYLHLIVSEADLVLESGADRLVSYRFATGAAEHLFCQACGIKSFYRPRSHPKGWSINFRCLDSGHGLTATIRPFDGDNWESARADLDRPTA
jgi:hypothetical protein